ncbi:MAG: polyribonucleotide nucleotidyltransferase [Alphaproteobacteria bacterium]|nr:polyribonucleotide nucleotidyltransferase [Alphaproteobacteria bacterium]
MSMFNETRKEIEWGGRTLVLETGKVARQADGAVIATLGGTKVLATACGSRKAPTVDFFPLTVNYQEKTYAAGKIPGGFFKREGRPSEKETLVSRLIDRPIRPLFAEGYRNETQVICSVLAHDLENDPDVVAMIAASAALTISGIPFMGPIGCARVGYVDGGYVLNPTTTELQSSTLDLVVAGTREGVLMVESEAQELTESIMLGGVNYAHEQMQAVIDVIIDLAEDCAKEPWDIQVAPAELDIVKAKFTEAYSEEIKAVYELTAKAERRLKLEDITARALASVEDNEAELKHAHKVLKQLESDVVRQKVLKTGMRIDGRDTTTVRPIVAEAKFLPRAHGSALFTRGETQALVITTLGTGHDEQIIDALAGEYKENFMLHYNFPPYSVGEVGRMFGPGRREIGHGKLAWRAISPMLPTKEEFPYTMRVVSEITESNGSSSMATVCGTSLALMDAGVPLKKPVSGIAMGLIKEGDEFAVLTDILGDEDHLGDMDFKVAGTADGITSLQMDIKITSITSEIMEIALQQAHDGRAHILDEMAKALTESRDDVSEFAPRITTMQVKKDKIRDVIGSGGKVIREIIEKTGCKIDINDDGIVSIASTSAEDSAAAEKWISDIVAEPEMNAIYEGKVVKIMDFGAFVNFLGSKDGLVHISEILPKRIDKVEDVLNEGDSVKVKVIGFDRGKVKLSMKRVDQETGADIDQG